MGNITARLYEKDTPVTVWNFVALAQGVKATLNPKTGKLVKVPLYDNITFHRVLPGVMIQSGDPTGTGSHNGKHWRARFGRLPVLYHHRSHA